MVNFRGLVGNGKFPRVGGKSYTSANIPLLTSNVNIQKYHVKKSFVPRLLLSQPGATGVLSNRRRGSVTCHLKDGYTGVLHTSRHFCCGVHVTSGWYACKQEHSAHIQSESSFQSNVKCLHEVGKQT